MNGIVIVAVLAVALLLMVVCESLGVGFGPIFLIRHLRRLRKAKK